MELALQPANRNACAARAFPKPSYLSRSLPMMKRWARPLHEEARSNPTELPRSNAKFSPLVFITLRIPLPCRPLRIDFYSHDFHTLTSPLSRNSFVCTSIQNPGRVTGGYYPNWSTLAAQREPQATSFQQFAASCSLLPLFWKLPPFVFNRLQPLFPKHPGGGGCTRDV